MAEGYKHIVEALDAAGVDTMFGVMGEGNMPIIDHWVHDLGKRYVAARHEGGAVSMAEGYARVGNRIGVATVTQGPGVTNTLTALTSAVRHKARVLLLAGALPTEGSPSAQNIDHKALAAPTGAGYGRLTSIHTARRGLYDALHLLQRTGRPVVLDLPIDIQEMSWPRSDETLRDVTAVTQHPRPSHELLERATKLLGDAQRPVILAGKGAALSGARDALVALAEHLGAPLATSLQGKGLFGGHPLDVGVAGGFAHQHAQTILGNSDLVLAVGASLNTWTMQHGATFPGASIVHVDTDPAVIASYADVELGIFGDARTTADELLQLVRERCTEQVERRQSVQDTIAAARTEDEERLRADGELTEGEKVVAAVESVLPPERNVVLDAGHFMGWPILHLSVPEPSAFVWTCDFGSIGLGVATGIGAALARPDRTTVVVAGDGGLLMGLGELETVGRTRVPMVILVLDDGAYGAEVQILRHQGRHGETATFENPDFTALAGVLGLDAMTLATTDDLAELDRRVTDLDRPLLVHSRIGDDLAPWFQHMIGG